jgi:glutathione synthase/RimK-type ligase-like ATP-grasp enzyme
MVGNLQNRWPGMGPGGKNMNEPIIFVGPNRRITPLQVEALQAGFQPIQISALDIDYPYSVKKLKQLLSDLNGPALFRFIYPFYDYHFRALVAQKEAAGMDNATATQEVFEHMVAGWRHLWSDVDVPIIPVNSLEAMTVVKNKSLQYRSIQAHMKEALPETIFLEDGMQIEKLVQMLDKYGGIVYKPICGSRSQGIVIITRDSRGYRFLSDIKYNRRSYIYTGDIRVKLREMHNPYFVVQEKLSYADFYDNREFDIRVHIIDGRITRSAAFVFNQAIKDEEVYSLALASEKDPRMRDVVREAEAISIDVTRVLGLHVSGVDLYITADYKPKITEVNCFPGWKTMLDLDPDHNVATEEIALYKRLLRQ